jgi:hypothetical protein
MILGNVCYLGDKLSEEEVMILISAADKVNIFLYTLNSFINAKIKIRILLAAPFYCNYLLVNVN